MFRIYKICIVNNPGETSGEVFAVKLLMDFNQSLGSFDRFKEEIFIRMPELKNQPLKIYYQDADGDNVTIFNALDFGIFQDQKINKVFVVKNAAVKSVQFQENPSIASNAPTESTSAPNRAYHENVICDGCDKEIYGYRYKCLECADFDLCMECEPKQHNHHLMIRIAHPNDAEICYKSKLGKRFLRHRRSESLCSKDEKVGKHHHYHHKRHASNASVRPPHPFGNFVSGVLQSFVDNPYQNDNANANASTNTEVSSQKVDGKKSQKIHNGQPATTAKAPVFGTSAASASGRPMVVGDFVRDFLQVLDTSKQNANASTNTGKAEGEKQEKTVNATATKPTSAPNVPSFGTTVPPYGFNVAGDADSKKSPDVPLKQSIDMLSHMAQNFAAMMDPFATYMEKSANSSAATSAAAAAAAAATAAKAAAKAAANSSIVATTAAMAKLADATIAPIENVLNNASTSTESAEPMNCDQEPNNDDVCLDSGAMIIDCDDDDEDEALRNLVTSLNVNTSNSNNDAAEATKKDSVTSIENEKGSPSREWTFIDSSEVAEASGPMGSNLGAIPKRSTPPLAENAGNSTNVDYAELSRLLSTHIDAQKKDAATPAAQPQIEDKIEPEVTDITAKTTKTPPPTPLHPDARVNEAITAMMAMGFSNEGGWLTQLLETVDGSISNALDLLQPHK